jgi:hypothetical protein
MQPPDKIRYHEGLSDLLEMKTAMLHTVWRYCLVGLGLAFLVALFITLGDSTLWADLRDFIHHR